MAAKLTDIELIRQDPDSDDCLRACALMAFRYFGDKITKDEIWRKLHVYKKHSGLYGGYYWDLARIFIKRGYKATINHYDWHWWSEKEKELYSKSVKSLIKYLQKAKGYRNKFSGKKMAAKEIAFLKSGGDYNFQIPSAESVDSYLQRNLPVFVSVWAQDLYKNPSENYIHAFLVVGKQNGNYLLRDPYLALDKINIDDLIFASIRNSGWMMVIEPKEKLPAVEQTQLI